MPSCGDYIMHFLTLPWKLIFAIIPPTGKLLFFLLIPNQSCNEDFGEGPLLLDPWLCSYFRGERQADFHSINYPKPLKNFVAPLFQIYRVIKRRGRKCHFSCSSFDHPLILGHNSMQPVIGQLSLILCPLGFMTHGLYLPVFNSQHQ